MTPPASVSPLLPLIPPVNSIEPLLGHGVWMIPSTAPKSMGAAMVVRGEPPGGGLMNTAPLLSDNVAGPDSSSVPPGLGLRVSELTVAAEATAASTVSLRFDVVTPAGIDVTNSAALSGRSDPSPSNVTGVTSVPSCLIHGMMPTCGVPAAPGPTSGGGLRIRTDPESDPALSVARLLRTICGV